MASTNIIKEVVQKAKQKDAVAMNWLYEKYVSEMLTLSYRMTNDLGTSEDIIQESFLNSFQKIEQLKKPEQYRSWLKRIVVTNSLKRIKKKKMYKTIDESIMEEEPIEPKWYEQLKFETINRVIQKLPEGCRQILTLYLLDDFKHKEIAEFLNISISTSKSQYQYGLKILRSQLKNEFNDRSGAIH